jgi:hypothetical protein
VINVLFFKLGECVHLVFRIVSNMFLRQKFDLAFVEPGPSKLIKNGKSVRLSG